MQVAGDQRLVSSPKLGARVPALVVRDPAPLSLRHWIHVPTGGQPLSTGSESRIMSSSLRLVRDTDPVDIALGFPGPESPLTFDDHVKEGLALHFRPTTGRHSGKGRHSRTGVRLLTPRERYAVATSALFVAAVIAVV